MGRKLIGIDLDNTTLNDAGQVSLMTQQMIRKAQQAGHVVAIVTGRPVRLSTEIYRQLGLVSPMINFNGALGEIPNMPWEHAYSYKVDREIAFDLIENANDLAIKSIVAENRSEVWTNSMIAPKNPAEAFFFPQNEATTQMLNRLNLKKNINSILIEAQNETHQNMIQQYVTDRYGAERVMVKTWGANSPVLEIAPAGVAKDTGLQILKRAFNIDKANVYAFGDEMNDYEMIDYATHGVVMKNGNSQLKEIANDVTDYTNDEDGLAKYLAKII
ncbi:Cof-type HAD-IIB family hydrolase [Weissella hellenica]|uniref:Cof-type HAD-IIB family hydrolase n=1 Tax=Weissella hellenica TaxID=46256 RepID=A0A4Y4G879_WEIHE|nr:Cof-type HAD-IIB family hydrolase [Weissella hellenica]NKY67302.1 Cof-type HAD-IIB family hydrolase [Weissella hellenica]GED36331.1 haloacid dehalogenase [Weissella hellenica]SCC02536.1 hypothetical protein GA0061075_11135 [Weissella hellenica]